jgi:hypothetical protein
MHAQDEPKDGRYFPSLKEQSILMQSIDKYFQLPERSEERSLVVQSVTGQLAEINTRWTNRAVRLWFNNNKRSCLKSQVQFDPAQVRGFSLSTDQIPLKKRPPRSPSVGSFVCPRPFSPPADAAIGDSLSAIFSAASQSGQTDDDRRSLEAELTDKLVECNAKIWRDNVGPIDPNFHHDVPKTLAIGVVPDVLAKYAQLDCGIFVRGVAAVVAETDDDTKELEFGDRRMAFAQYGHASGVAFDDITGDFLIAAGTAVYQISGHDDLRVRQILSPKCPLFLRSALATTGDAIILGARRQLHFWPRSTTSSDSMYSTETRLPSITSLAHIEPFLAAASRNHHSIHLFNTEGLLCMVFIGHASGVTCVKAVGNGTFLSGSVDQTTKLWDFRTASSVGHFGKHHSPVSFVGSSVIDGTWHAITGGEDHVVRVWDLRMARPLFETHVGAGVPISADLTRTELGRTLNVLTKEKDSTCAEGFQVPRPTEAPQLFESCSNLWIRFLVENPDIAPS